MKKESAATSYRFSQSTLELLTMLSDKEGISKTQILENAVYLYASQGNAPSGQAASAEAPASGKTGTPSAPSPTAVLSKQYDRLLEIIRSVDESCFHQLNLINSICDSLAADDDTYSSASSDPTDWLRRSIQERRNTILSRQTKAMLAGKEATK